MLPDAARPARHRTAMRIALTVVALLLAALLIFSAASEYIIRRDHRIAPVAIAVPHDAASIAEGARLATLLGCPSCHGDGKGAVWTPVDRWYGQVAPPAIARRLADYSDAEVARLIRHGVTRRGATLFVMPTWSERNLADDDLGRIIAWARTLRPAPDDSLADTWWGPEARWQMLGGDLRQSAVAESVAPKARPADSGRYFTQALCAECHDLHADRTHDSETVPALAPIAAAYSDADFHRLLRTGVAAGGRKLGLMATIAGENLHALHDDEIAMIHRYLKAEASKQP
ncbi:c-type cytochrome [Sphingomonas sp. RT2P30]|uniref:c-type cytochrome n=1 Tax=Parasphingomonas halimpatiens TaxID=3096162 RepID=UPI002FC5994D